MLPVLTAERRPLPVAPRPFEAEVLGGWIGRLASRYRMTVSEFAERHSLDLKIEDGGGWLTMPALGEPSASVLAAITRISREQIMAIHAPPQSSHKRSHFCYCARCVFLNPVDVAAPIWRWEWLDETLSTCPLHKDEFTTLPCCRVRACGNLMQLLQLVSRNERDLHHENLRIRASVVR